MNPAKPTSPSPHGPSKTSPIAVALVGHCGPDSWMLKSVVERAFPVAHVAMVNDAASARLHAEKADLLMVNRELDGDFGTGSGLDLIRVLMSLPRRRAAIMLVSNYADAQAQAEALGAAPGFGKAKAGTPEAAQRMRAAVERVLAVP